MSSSFFPREKTLPTGEIVELIRDPNRPNEPFAVAVWTPGELGRLGYCKWWFNCATIEKAEVEYARWS